MNRNTQVRIEEVNGKTAVTLRVALPRPMDGFARICMFSPDESRGLANAIAHAARDAWPRYPVESAERVMQDIARNVEERIPHGYGFVVLLTSFGENGFASWVGNIGRENLPKALREWADTVERGET